MSQKKTNQSLENLGKALARLEEALAIPSPSGVVIDGTIQRFEFCLELFWKTLKRLLQDEGIIVNTPKETLKAAFQNHWLHDETAWLEMLNDRNLTSHVYDEEMALRIYGDIRGNFPEMKRVFQEMLTREN